MREPPTANATWKFADPCEYFQNSESFWSSLFGLFLLSAGRPDAIELPMMTPLPAAPWFELRDDSWQVSGLQCNDVVVEGKSGLSEFASMRSGAQFRADDFAGLPDLNSDIAVWQKSELILVEVKTIRARLSQYQVTKYLRWAVALTSAGCPTKSVFLLSSGHENGGDHEWLVNANGQPGFGGVLLWEHVFQVANDLAAKGAPLPAFLKSVRLVDLAD